MHMVGMWHLIILVLEGMFGKIHALGAGQNDAVVTHVWWSDWSEMNAGWSTEGGPQFTHDWSQAPRLTTVHCSGAPAEVPSDGHVELLICCNQFLSDQYTFQF